MIGLDSYSRQGFIYLDPILIYISLWIDSLFKIYKIAVCFLWLSLPGDYRVTDEAFLAETTYYDPSSFWWIFSLLLKDLISDFYLCSKNTGITYIYTSFYSITIPTRTDFERIRKNIFCIYLGQKGG